MVSVSKNHLTEQAPTKIGRWKSRSKSPSRTETRSLSRSRSRSRRRSASPSPERNIFRMEKKITSDPVIKKSSSPELSKNAKTSPQMNIFQEARAHLSLSMFVYFVVEMRRMSLLGNTFVPFDKLKVEADNMTISELFKNSPHQVPGEKAGRSSTEIMFCVIQAVAKRNGVPSTVNPWKRMKNAIRAMKAMGIDLNQRRILDKTQRRIEAANNTFDLDVGAFGRLEGIEEMFKEALFDAPDGPQKKGAKCPCADSHVGYICEKEGFHHMQCFFDQVYRKAKTDEDFAAFLNLIHTWEPSDGAAEVERRFQKVMPRLCRPDSQLLEMANTAVNHKIVWINDSQQHDTCVYMILVNKKEKSVTVTFRGSETLSDWYANLRPYTVDVKNPVEADYEGKDEKITIQGGYYNYLISQRLDNSISKYEEIAFRAYEYGLELGDFTLCVNGHSMGGALATIFGFFASVDSRFNARPVRVFTFGASYAGRVSFAKAFQHQEKANKIMLVRCVNQKDLIPLCKSPFQLIDPRNYAHCGIYVELYDSEHKMPSVSYLEDMEWWRSFSCAVTRSQYLNWFWTRMGPVSAIKEHVLSGYVRVFNKQEMALSKMKVASLDKTYDYYVRKKNPKNFGQPSWTHYVLPLLGATYFILFCGLLFSLPSLVMFASFFLDPGF